MDKSVNKIEVMSYYATESVRSPGRKKLFQLFKDKTFWTFSLSLRSKSNELFRISLLYLIPTTPFPFKTRKSEVFRKRKIVSKIKLFRLWVCHNAPNRMNYFEFPRFPAFSDTYNAISLKKAEVWGLQEEENYFKYKTFLSLSLYAPNRMNYFGFPAWFSDTYKRHFPTKNAEVWGTGDPDVISHIRRCLSIDTH